jgi:hypothetical protein
MQGSRAAWLAALVCLLSPLASLQAVEAVAKETPVAKAATAAKPETAAKSDAAAKPSDSAAKPETVAAKDAALTKTASADTKSAAKDEKAENGVSHKSPGVAGGLAFFPGVVIHGAGHMYAGSWVKGLGLLAVEGAAVGIGIAQYNNGSDELKTLMDGFKNKQIPSDVGGAYQTIGIATVATMAFVWTWFDDMAGAPIAASEYNRLADEAAGQARLQILPNGDGATLALVKNF